MTDVERLAQMTRALEAINEASELMHTAMDGGHNIPLIIEAFDAYHKKYNAAPAPLPDSIHFMLHRQYSRALRESAD